MLSVIYADCHILALYSECNYAECHYGKCHYAECHYAEFRGAFKCYVYNYVCIFIDL
jgi:hypothetical protein